MTDLNQKPALIDIYVASDDSFSSLVDFDIVLTGYTVTAKVMHDGTSTAFTVVDTDLSAGQITISLTQAQITAIGVGKYKWYLHYVKTTTSRRALSGSFNIINYP